MFDPLRAAAGLKRLFVVIVLTFAVAFPRPASAQRPLATLDEARHTMTAGDTIEVGDVNGGVVKGTLLRFGDTELDVRVKMAQPDGSVAQPQVTIPLRNVRWLERTPDPASNGAIIGAAVGGGAVAAMMVVAFAVDANESDEWIGIYLAGAAGCAGAGALIGWAIDRAHSKPRVRFDASPTSDVKISFRPVNAHTWRGAVMVISF